jgi:hypothetical protein
MEGETGGYYPMGFETGVAVQMPLRNSSDDVADVQSGKIEVVKDTTPIE